MAEAGNPSVPAPVIHKGSIFCRVKTIQGTPKVPVGAPGIANESKLTFHLAHMTNSLVQG